MKFAVRTSVLSAVIAAVALLSPLQQSSPASAASPRMHTHIFDFLMQAPTAWVPANATVHQSYVNGEPCGVGIVDATVLPYTFNVVFSVPAECAYPGAPIEFIVNGYALKDGAGWGVNVMSEEDGTGYTGLSNSFLIGPAGRWTGTLRGAPAGSLVEARIDGKTCGTTNSFGVQSRYGVVQSGFDLKVMPAAPSPYGIAYCGFDGAHIEFFVNGVKTDQAATWSTGTHLITLVAP